jgi:membrane-associated protease RseP (regulator of RpoE activity)
MSEPALPVSSAPDFYKPVEVFIAPPPQRRTWIYLLFFFLTVLSTLVVGARMQVNFLNHAPALSIPEDGPSVFPVIWAFRHPSNLLLGVPFSFTLMLILFSHEMGHYLYCRHYGVYATLPFFVPFPSLIGTLGAFIRIRSPIRSRSALFDIGIAGPIAGFVVACIALAVGLILSHPTAAPANSSELQLGYPLIFHLANRWFHGATALPLAQVTLHPVAIAAWVGMFATALNLLPGGQLDGGHIVFSISPRVHRFVSSATILVLIFLGINRWTGWLIWAVLLRITGMRHPLVPEFPGITPNRRWVAITAAIMLLLTFTWTPILNSSGVEVWQQLREGIRQYRSGK